MDLMESCRLCLTKCEKSIDIFSDDGIKLEIASILSQHFWFQVLEDDELSRMICTKCWLCIDKFHTFYNTVKAVQTEYFKDTNSTKLGTCNAHNNENNKSLKFEQKFLEVNIKENVGNHNLSRSVKDEGQSDCDDEEMFCQPDIMNYPNNDTTPFSDEDEMPLQQLSKQKIKPNKTQQKEKITMKNAVLLKTSKDKKQDIELDDSKIREYFKMECEICSEKFDTFLEAKRHYRFKHKIGGYISCCGRKFFRRGSVIDHIVRHLNPDAFKCDICNKKYVDKSALRNHMEYHNPKVLKPFECRICRKCFEKQYKLSQHIKLQHCTENDKKFSCDECGKNFISKSVLASHIRGVHEFAYAQICDICARVFKSKKVFEIHRLQHLKIAQPKLQCNICGSWLKHELSLRAHMNRHNDTSRVCKICNKSTPNRQALGNHMKNVHSERIHQCTMCEKAFKQPIRLREHMASHTGKNLYTCPYCPKTFNSGANMHSHRKKAHFDEWEMDRGKRHVGNPTV